MWNIGLFWICIKLSDVLGLSISIEPQHIIVKQGDLIRVQCRVGVGLEGCVFEIPSEPALSLNPSKAPYKQIKYFGEGLERGSCGVELVAREAYNGIISCSVTPNGQVVTTKANMSLIVAIKPSRPEISISKPQKTSTAYMENELVTANCVVKNGRPAANISWFIGDSKITEGLAVPTEQVTTGEIYTIGQTLTRKLRATDNGKELKCVAGHTLLTIQEGSVARQLSVYFPPKPSSEPIEHFGLVEGEEGRVSVTVLANPPPKITWRLGDLRIHQGESDETGRFKVPLPTENKIKGSGYWECLLIINPLEKEDVERDYVLSASNAYGEQTYKVAISTNPEPRMLELGAGTIVGIVVAILLILIITSILVFARAKGRWCFAGKTGPRAAGESSDTESADHHHSTKNTGPKAKMTFTKVFKKKGDKVGSDPEEIKDVTVVDEKNVCSSPINEEEVQENLNLNPITDEGVVYAELDLQNSTATRGLLVKPEDEKTEYAEIIHTQNNNK